MDERNPENSMLYFPTEQEWSQMVRPNRIDMDKRFSDRYAVNDVDHTAFMCAWLCLPAHAHVLF